jgi:hypothetical protein
MGMLHKDLHSAPCLQETWAQNNNTTDLLDKQTTQGVGQEHYRALQSNVCVWGVGGGGGWE